MTGDRSHLTNFVNKFLDAVKFKNDHAVKILGYGDYQIGNVTISWVYYMEGLGHNLMTYSLTSGPNTKNTANRLAPSAKKQSDQASRQISKQTSRSANAPYDLVFTAMGPPLGTTQTTATITTPPQMVPGTNTTEPPPTPLRNKGPELGDGNLTLEGVATELAPSDFVSQNYETLVALK
ncbi:hypothetical protein Tco_0170523 [Tanacetum coccineum]